MIGSERVDADTNRAVCVVECGVITGPNPESSDGTSEFNADIGLHFFF
jgi:hypothetical protein